MNKYITKAVQLAVEQAECSPHSHKHCAVTLDRRGNVLNVGYNNKGSSWIQRMYAKKVGKPDKTYTHAEVDALRKSQAPYYLVVVRINSRNKLMNSAPCEICRELIKDSGVKEVYHSIDNGVIKWDH